MTIGEKLRYLRELEGTLRGLAGPMTQQAVVRAIRTELNETISQSYLSQIENGTRSHLPNSTRLLLARFFKVDLAYLVDDKEARKIELASLPSEEEKIDLWLIDGAHQFRGDTAFSSALLDVANHSNSRQCLILLQAIVHAPGLANRLMRILSIEGPT